MARAPKKIEIPGDVVTEPAELSTPVIESAPSAKAKAVAKLMSPPTPPQDLVEYSERRGEWVLTRNGWLHHPDK